MRSIPNSTRSLSVSATLGQAGSFTEDIAGQDDYKELKTKANSVPMKRLFKYYGIKLDEINRFIICPFKHHKGGRENTASFQFYPPSNTFYCHGCKTGVSPIIFVQNMENISFSKAMYKILDNFSEDIDESYVYEPEDSEEALDIMLDLSTHIREFREKFPDQKAFDFIEDVCFTIDQVHIKHKIDNEALRHIVDELKEKILAYHG